MQLLPHRTKIVATIGPASNSPQVVRKLLQAGMSVARLNFSHGSYEAHAQNIQMLRSLADEMDLPLALLQDLQGPKIRVGQIPEPGIQLIEGEYLTLVPLEIFDGHPGTIGIDYPYVAEEAEPGTQVLLADGLMELTVEDVQGKAVLCRVVEGGVLTSRKGVNFPSLNLRLPSMTEKDKQDLEFGIEQGVDIISLSFVRKPEDVRELKDLLKAKGADIPVLAKIEKPQAVQNFEAIAEEVDAIMVARGDLGVELRPEKVPAIQKHIIRLCNQKGIPVITATQMLESMIHNARPTRAEASDVANAIIDGTDAVMLSGESAMGDFPVQAVEMLARIAAEIEPTIEFPNFPPNKMDETHAISEALNTIDSILDLRCICAFTMTGFTASLAAAERPRAPIVAFTSDRAIYNRLNLIWGVKPLLLENAITSTDELAKIAETTLYERGMANPGDKVLIMGGNPIQTAKTTNFLNIYTLQPK
ncbi:MAG: pyruvate kinase [Oscillatoriales cyanobacterium C42_A2020_001]|nr:pyruvate kinase [Leptolyngbyaceae cyanobacterium C42_A2020_001]